MIDGTAALLGTVDDADPLVPANWPILRASSEEVDANVDDDVALVPELSDGADNEEADPEFETPVLVREL